MPFQEKSHKYQWNVGEGIYSRGNKEKLYHYSLWGKLKVLADSKNYNFIVDESWLNLQNFGLWVDEQLIELTPFKDGYCLNYRLFQTEELPNIYIGPETCCLIPKKYNSVFVNMFSADKTKHEGNENLPIGVSRYDYDKTRFVSIVKYKRCIYWS